MVTPTVKTYSGVTNAMLNSKISITFEPTVLLAARAYLGLHYRIKSTREPLEQSVREVIIPSIRRNFEVGGRPPWAPLEGITQDMRRRQGYSPDDILIRSGKLLKGVTQLNNWKYSTSSAIMEKIPANVWYGQVHQQGLGGAARTKKPTARLSLSQKQARLKALVGHAGRNTANRVNIPARPFVMLQPEDEVKIRKIFDDWFSRRLAEVTL